MNTERPSNFHPIRAIAAVTITLTACSANAATIGLWDGWDGAAGTASGSSFVEADSFGLVSTTPRVTEPNAATGAFRDIDQTARGSNDGTFGTIGSPAAQTATTGGLRIEKGSNATDPTEVVTLWVSIVNDTAQTIAFDTFAFDAVFTQSNATAISKNAYDLSFINQTTNVTTSGLGSGTFLNTGTTAGDFDDIDIDVSGVMLGAGETGVFSIGFSGSTSINPGSHLDNLLVTGDLVTIPEPGSVSLLALAGLSLLRRRRK